MTAAQRDALQEANAKEQAMYAAFNTAVENIRAKTMSAKQATRKLNEAKDAYVVALKALHAAMKK